MIIDFHTHVFPPDIYSHREDYLQRDPTFQTLYVSPRARIATAPQLLESMDASGIDRSVVVSFAWRDSEIRRRTNDYILEQAAASGGRLIPFCTIDPASNDACLELERCVRGGARGLGELRPDDQGYDLSPGGPADLLVSAASAHNLVILFHVSEPVGHEYAGKKGLSLDSFYRFVEAAPKARVVGAHWAGGLPFYALMPRAKTNLVNVYFDSAGTGLLYEASVYRHAIDIAGVDRVLFGSDFPFFSQMRSRREIDGARLSEEEKRLVTGENARRLLELDNDH
jgi:predicted TIM-barrel fold metal-dependent hydrolase